MLRPWRDSTGWRGWTSQADPHRRGKAGSHQHRTWRDEQPGSSCGSATGGCGQPSTSPVPSTGVVRGEEETDHSLEEGGNATDPS